MKKIIENMVRYFLFKILKLFRYGPALEHEFLKVENKILHKKLREQGISIDDMDSGYSSDHESTKT